MQLEEEKILHSDASAPGTPRRGISAVPAVPSVSSVSAVPAVSSVPGRIAKPLTQPGRPAKGQETGSHKREAPAGPVPPQTPAKKTRMSLALHTPPRHPKQPLSLQDYEEVEKANGFMPSKENGGALSHSRVELSPVVMESLHLPKLEMKESRSASATKLSKEQFAKQQQDEIELLLSETSGCNCKGKCSSRKCPCRNYGRTCGAQCKCQHDKCTNRVGEPSRL